MSSRFLRVRQLSVIPRKAVGLEMTDKGTPHSGTPVAASPSTDPGAPAVGIPFSGAPHLAIPPKIRRAVLAQDGHSLGEQALYEALWTQGTPHDSESRIVSMGYRQMAEAARMTVNNCKANVFSLMEKLALEELASYTHSQGRTYRVLGYSAILQRRKAAGLTHYVRTRGVAFVDPDSGIAITLRSRKSGLETGIPGSGTPHKGTPEKGQSGTPPSAKRGTPFSTGTPNRKELRQTIETSTAMAAVFRAVREELAPIDDEAARRILENCYEKAPDATDEELEHFVRLTATRIRNMRRVENPVGLLIAQIPKCFAGESFQQFRKAEEQKREQGRELPPEELQRYRAVVDDPQTSETEKRIAWAALGAR